MASIDDIITAAQLLPPADRAELITRFWDNLSPDDWPLPSQAWIEEANRRSDAIDAGSMIAESWEVVRERVSQARQGDTC